VAKTTNGEGDIVPTIQTMGGAWDRKAKNCGFPQILEKDQSQFKRVKIEMGKETRE